MNEFSPYLTDDIVLVWDLSVQRAKKKKKGPLY